MGERIDWVQKGREREREGSGGSKMEREKNVAGVSKKEIERVWERKRIRGKRRASMSQRSFLHQQKGRCNEYKWFVLSWPRPVICACVCERVCVYSWGYRFAISLLCQWCIGSTLAFSSTTHTIIHTHTHKLRYTFFFNGFHSPPV